jgi:hypothetical protein
MKNLLKYLGLLLYINFLYAGPPMMSDDPFTPEVNELEINFASEVENGEDLTIVAPIIDINYGIYPHLQLTLERAYAFSNSHYNSNGLEVALKYHFYRGDILNIALYPKYLFYPINTPFDDGESYEFQIPISVQLSNNLEWVSSFSYLYPQKEKSHYEIGSYLAYTQKQATYYIETYIEENPTQRSIATTLNMGYFYQYRENIGFMGSIGYESINAKKEAILSYLGLQIIF